MPKEEFYKLLEKNKEQVKKASEDFDKHSENFDKKIKKILSLL